MTVHVAAWCVPYLCPVDPSWMTRDLCARADVHRGLCLSLYFRHTLRLSVDASATGLFPAKGSDFEFFFDVSDCDRPDLLSGGLSILELYFDHLIGLSKLEPEHLKHPRSDISAGAYAVALLFPL